MGGVRELNYEVQGISALIGKVISIEEWARRAQIPNAKAPGVLDGKTVEHVLGIRAKSWDPELFQDLRPVVAVARSALASARLRPEEVEAAIVVTCTPYQLMLDQDTFNLFRALRLPDSVVPLQLGAGCAGLAPVISRGASTSCTVTTMSTPSGRGCGPHPPSSRTGPPRSS